MSDTKEATSAMSKRDSSTTESAGVTTTPPAPAEVESDLEMDMPDMGQWTQLVFDAMPADGSPITSFAIAHDIGETSPNGLWLVNQCLDDLATSDAAVLEPNQLFWRRTEDAA